MQNQIAQTTAEVYAAIHPDEALQSGDSRYVSLDEARGTHNVAQSLTQRIVALEGYLHDETRPSSYARFLVTGHRGCGKTTEFHRLRALLSQESMAVIYFDAESELNLQELKWWNVLLEMVLQIDAQLAREPYNIHLPPHLLDDAVEWLARAITKKTEKRDIEGALETEFGMEGGLPFFAKAKAAIRAAIKNSSSTVKDIELEIDRRPGQLHEAVQSVVCAARAALREQGTRDLVVIADGLEKIPLRPLGEGLTTHNELFVHNGSHLKTPLCHLVYTLPFALLNSDKVGEVFPEMLRFPMIRICNRRGEANEKAMALLSQVMERRVNLALFEEGVLRKLSLASGGHIRDFLFLVHDAATSFQERISLAHAERAIANLTDLYNLTIKQQFIPSLDYIQQNKIMQGGDLDGQLIYLLLVLEYSNGEVWSDLHPCVKNAPRYVRSPRQPAHEPNETERTNE